MKCFLFLPSLKVYTTTTDASFLARWLFVIAFQHRRRAKDFTRFTETGTRRLTCIPDRISDLLFCEGVADGILIRRAQVKNTPVMQSRSKPRFSESWLESVGFFSCEKYRYIFCESKKK